MPLQCNAMRSLDETASLFNVDNDAVKRTIDDDPEFLNRLILILEAHDIPNCMSRFAWFLTKQIVADSVLQTVCSRVVSFIKIILHLANGLQGPKVGYMGEHFVEIRVFCGGKARKGVGSIENKDQKALTAMVQRVEDHIHSASPDIDGIMGFTCCQDFS
uniref:Uncharacterized protein n=1 Tax=Salix viminalis TaxID=40686 RepID=A0A6N2LF66_SALVM